MFKVGDVVVYSVHGLCRINDICEKTIANETKMYYVLNPLDQPSLTISTPVENKGLIMKMMDKEEAEEILHSFAEPGVDWINEVRKRMAQYNQMVKSGDRRQIAGVLNTLMCKNLEASVNKKKLYDQDRRLMENIQNVLFKELARVLDKSLDEVYSLVEEMVMKQINAAKETV